MSIHTLSQINIYPVKSLAGISLNQAVVEERGFRYDRRWMLIDGENKFITQRYFPQMVFINVSIENDKLVFMHNIKSLPPLSISMYKFPQTETEVCVWEDKCSALEYEENINEWFSAAIDFKCKLVYMPNTTKRKTRIEYFSHSKYVSFADGYPYLIIGESSLELLNSQLDDPVKMIQFRPNIVFRGGSAHDEDNWKEIEIGSITFAVVKPCDRCVITTINPETAIKNKEPLKTLSTYRNFNSKIIFGQNAIALSKGVLNVGDKIFLNKI